MCARMHTRKHRLTGAHTHAHTIQKSHITHEILMVQSNQQKWRWGRQRGRQKGGVGSKEERRMKAICLYYQSWSGMWAISKMICILDHHFYQECDQPTETTYFLPQRCVYSIEQQSKVIPSAKMSSCRSTLATMST